MIPGRNFPPRKPSRRENVNESIRAREVRAVFPDGTAEVMPTAAALRRAQELGLDLDAHIGFCIAAMRRHADALGLAGVAASSPLP